MPAQSVFFQMMTAAAPMIMPASAPWRFMRGHSSDSSTTGPKAAPKPAQA